MTRNNLSFLGKASTIPFGICQITITVRDKLSYAKPSGIRKSRVLGFHEISFFQTSFPGQAPGLLTRST